MSIISNGINKVDTESELVLQSTEYHFPDDCFYKEVEGFGAIRYWITPNAIECEGYVPWVGY